MRKRSNKSFKSQANERVQIEAFQIAKATQQPGQTKEQTKLIAKGIEKGIAQWKRQQKVKIRQRDKEQKKLSQARAQEMDQQNDATLPLVDRPRRLKLCLILGGTWLTLSAVGLISAYLLELKLMLQNIPLPDLGFLVAAIPIGLVGLWQLVLMKRLKD